MRRQLQAARASVRSPARLAYWLRRAGVRKTANMLLIEAERAMRRTRLRGKPYYYFVDPCNVCNLRCPLCVTGNGLLDRSRGLLRLQDYQTILDKIAPYAVHISLHNWGEPLLNPEIFEIIGATGKRGIAPTMSSNLNVEKDRFGERIVESGLDYLIVSLDGLTQQTYEQYRVRGKIDLVFDNIRAIIEARKRLKRHTPLIEWQFLVFRHNEHEVERARAQAASLGVDRFRPRSPCFPLQDYKLVDQPAQAAAEARWMPADPTYWEQHPGALRRAGYLWDEPCFYLYRTMTVNPGGGLASCCLAYKERQDFGNLLRDDLETVWNNEQYRRSRALFARAPAKRAGTVCDSCFLFKRPLGVAIAGEQTRTRLIAEERVTSAGGRAFAKQDRPGVDQ